MRRCAARAARRLLPSLIGFLGPIILVLVVSALAGGPEEISRMLAAVGKAHGSAARERVAAWRQIIMESAGLPEEEKLATVNAFFNRIPAGDDLALWGEPDYWATPLEFLVRNSGDCEDFAVAKYFTLRELGVPEARLRITYVTAFLADRRTLQPHMVLGYYPAPASEPLILDNLNPAILPASRRADLSPVFGFNGSGLWSARREKTAATQVNNENQPALWRKMLERMHAEPGGGIIAPH